MEPVRFVAPILLGLHILAKFLFPTPQLFLDLFLYILIAIASIVSIGFAQRSKGSPRALLYALLLWTCGALLSSYNEFYSTPHLSSSVINACYLLFYPFAYIGLTQTFRARRAFGAVEVLDATILGIGLSALGSAFLISPILPKFNGDPLKTFFAVLFPVSDLVLIALVLSLVVVSPFAWRNFLISLGVIAFSVSDFLFLWLTVHSQYSFGSISDDGWLLGFVLISEGLWHQGSEGASRESIHPIFIALSVMLSATLLAITTLRPGYLPNFILIPTIATLLLAFVRMTIALRQSRAIGEERFLARTDELTGLPNRRSFVVELEALTKTSDGALLLLDLDGFKPVNDEFGHDVGDQLLRQVSIRFIRALPQNAFLARLGGDEFGAIIHGDFESTFEAALALKATLSYPFAVSGHEIRVDVSVGHVANDGASNLLRRADSAMYHAKREGSGVWSEPANSVQFF